MSKILVTGATGALGSQTVEALLDRVAPSDVVAIARDVSKLRHFADRGVDVRHGDYDEPASLEVAFVGVEKLMFISTTTFGNGLQQHVNVVEAARKAGVRHVHYTAIQRGRRSDFVISQVTVLDTETEAALRRAGFAVTILRNALYLDALPFMLGDDVVERGVRVPAGSAAAALVSRRDLAEANAVILSGHGHEGLEYVLGGSESVTAADIATIITDAVGSPVVYEQTSIEDFVARRTESGLPAPVASFLAEWFEAVAAGEFAEVAGDLERLIGRRPETAHEFLSRVYKAQAAAGDHIATAA